MRMFLLFAFLVVTLPAMAQAPDRKLVLDNGQYQLDKIERQMQMGQGDWHSAVTAIEALSASLYPGDNPLDIKVNEATLPADAAAAGQNQTAIAWKQQIWPQVMPFYQKVRTELFAQP